MITLKQGRADPLQPVSKPLMGKGIASTPRRWHSVAMADYVVPLGGKVSLIPGLAWHYWRKRRGHYGEVEHVGMRTIALVTIDDDDAGDHVGAEHRCFDAAGVVLPRDPAPGVPHRKEHLVA